jgi:tripartite-type tricarboxylate transporter receptor subunit TctC
MSFIRKQAWTLWRTALTVAVAAAAMQPVHAEDKYPSHTILFISPLTGGAPDAMQRMIAESIRQRTGATVVVEARPGAGGGVAALAVANAAPDGYTVGMTYSGALVVNPLVNKDIKYDPVTSFAPLSLVARGGAILVSGAKFPPSNMAELVKAAKAAPQPYRVGFVSLSNKLALISIADYAGVKFQDVPFSTGGQMHAAVQNGDVELIIEATGSVYGMVREGRMKAIATGDRTRDPLFPEVGTISEALPGQLMTYWFGMIAPAKTPKDRANWLEREINTSLQDPLIKGRMYTAGINVIGGSAKALAEEIASSRTQFAKVVDKYHITQ